LSERQDGLHATLPTVLEEDRDAHKTAAAIRKETYAERDRVRAMDPGVLDFAADDDVDDETDTELIVEADQISMSRSRQHALKILEAGSKVPAEGLWRSLAN